MVEARRSIERFAQQGYLAFDSILVDAEVVALVDAISSLPLSGAGTRNVLENGWCGDLARKLKATPAVRNLLPPGAVAVQCTYFHKSAEKNWLVSWHQDQFIPVRQRIDAGENWSGWSKKEGVHFVRPPRTVLEQLIAIRVHLDANTAQNGPLIVVPGSHLNPGVQSEPVACEVAQGGVLAMKPLLRHASAKVQAGERRVLHFLFGPAQLPDGIEWHSAV